MYTTHWVAIIVSFCALASLAIEFVAMRRSRRGAALFLELFGFTALSAILVWYALSPLPSIPAEPPAIVGDLVAVNPYSVENQWGGPDAPWRPGGQWLIGGRNDQRVIALDVSSPDNGATLAGTMTYKGEDPIGLRANAIGANTYLVENHRGSPSEPWHKGGIWVLGARGPQQPVVALRAASADEGLTLTGTMTYKGEGPIGFRTKPLVTVQEQPVILQSQAAEQPPATVEPPATSPPPAVVGETGKFYRESDKPEVMFQYTAEYYCHIQSEDQMRTYGGAGRVIVAEKLQMSGRFAGACPWPDGFYRISIDGANKDYLLYGVGDVQHVGPKICRLLTPEQKNPYSNSGAFIDFGTISPQSDLARMRGDQSLANVDDCPWVGLERVSFAFNDDRLSPEARLSLDEIAKSYAIMLDQYKDEHPGKRYVIVVEGHTDYTGDDGYNCDLALRRAKSVAALLDKSILAGKEVSVVPIGFGFHRLLTSNPKGEKVAANRRFEVHLIEAGRLQSERQDAEACELATAEEHNPKKAQ
jgi:outer membrane protein OmpA-like peptidoglycan-associated protein